MLRSSFSSVLVVVVAVGAVVAVAGCSGRRSPTRELASGAVVVTASPFRLDVLGADGTRVFGIDDLREGTDRYAVENQVLPGWDGYRENVDAFLPVGVGTFVDDDTGAVVVEFAGDAEHAGGRVTVVAEDDVVRVRFALDEATQQRPKKTTFTVPLQEDEAFFGLGERFASVNHRGQTLYSFAEEGGLGGGEDPVEAAGTPYPNGPSMTYFPVPLVHSSAGYSLWLNTTRRSELALRDDVDAGRVGAWRAAVNGSDFEIVVYRVPPLRALDLYTAESGRPPIPAPWVWGPRRRVDFRDTAEWQRLREHHVPTTAVDDALHFLPHNDHVGQQEHIRAWTDELHDAGFKVMTYNNPYVSLTLPAAANEARFGIDNDLFIKNSGGDVGETFFISGEAQTIATIDLTNPAAVTFFQDLLRRSLDLGYDGWMHDFGEYVQYDWQAFDGSFGDTLHNRFPVLSAKAAFELLEAERPNDYLFFVRSGYSGSQAFIPAVWGGDAEATFDDTQGIPSALRSGLNLGMSGVPYWGSDGTGFKCLTGAPRDKEVYLRWAQLMAVSPIFMEQNACSNPLSPGQTKWTLWSDEETTTHYAAMARLHTRLQPYFELLAKEAHEHGTPIMRHVFLLHPDRVEARRSHEGFFLGPALFAAPVVRRGATEVRTWLPPGTFVDVDDHHVYVGDRDVTLPAPLLKLPLLLKAGELLPLLDERVETLADADDPDVVSAARMADRLDVWLALVPGQTAERTLVDGTVLRASLDSSGAAGPVGVVAGDAVVYDVDSARAADSSVVVDGVRLEHRGPRERTVHWRLYRVTP